MKLSIELLYPRVTEAIERAERLECDEPERANSAYLEVSRLEEAIARLLPPGDEEGAVARRGAVRAAVKAGDLPRANRLAEQFSNDRDADAQLKVQLKDLLETVIPGQAPAAIKVVAVDNRIQLPRLAAAADISGVELLAALSALRSALANLAQDAIGNANVDRRFVAFVQRTAEQIPSEPPCQNELFRLGHAVNVLELYSATVAAEWPSFLAAQYRSACLIARRMLRHYPQWRAFNAIVAQSSELTSRQLAEAPTAARLVAEALRTPALQEYFEPAIADALEALPKPQADGPQQAADAPLDLVAAGGSSLAIDVLQSIGNVVKQIVQLAASTESTVGGPKKEIMTEYFRTFRMSAATAVRQKVAEDIHAFSKRIQPVPPGAPGWGGLGSYLIRNFPDHFTWLKGQLDGYS